MLIGISGKKQHGKNTVADILVKNFKFQEIAFADSLKQVCSEVFDMPLIIFQKEEFKDRVFEVPVSIDVYHIESLISQLQDEVLIPEKSIQELHTKGLGVVLNSPREILQFVGTDLCRNCITNTIWVDIFLKKYKAMQGNVVCTDARMRNERELIKSLGGLNILVVRPELESKDGHISENDLGHESEYGAVITNDDTIFKLQHDVIAWYTLRSNR